MTGAALLTLQMRSDLARFWRNPQSRYFTLLLPIVFLVIFSAIFDGMTLVDGRAVKLTTFYVPGIMTLGIISATYVNLTVSVVARRESGELKRVRGTPLPAWVVIASRAAVGIVVAVVMCAVLLLIGRAVYGVPIPWRSMPALVLSIVVGAAAFCCLGFAVSSFITETDAAAPLANLTVLPLYFISGVFIPESQIPQFLRHLASLFPIRHLAQALLISFTAARGSGLRAGDLAIVAAWGVAGLVVAARRFRWSPQAG